MEWTRTFGRVVLKRTEGSPFVKVTRGRRCEVRFAEPFLYELDGDARKAVKRLRAAICPGSITICLPGSEGSGRAQSHRS